MKPLVQSLSTIVFILLMIVGSATLAYADVQMTSVSGSAAAAQNRTKKGTRLLVSGKTLPSNPPVSGEEPPPYAPAGTPNVSVWPFGLSLPLIRG